MDLSKDILTTEEPITENQQKQPQFRFGDLLSAGGTHKWNPSTDPSYFVNVLNNAILDADEIKSKSKRVVIERAPNNIDITGLAKNCY